MRGSSIFSSFRLDRSSQIELSALLMVAMILTIALAQPARANTYVVPHVLEKSGKITTNGIDDPFHDVSGDAGTMHDVALGQGETQHLVYDNPVVFLSQRNGATFTCQLDGAEFTVDAKGPDLYQYTLSGDISMQYGGVKFSKTGGPAFDLSVFGFDPQPIIAAPIAVPDVSGGINFHLTQELVFTADGGGNQSITLDTNTVISMVVPEPTCLTLAFGSGAALLARRRRT